MPEYRFFAYGVPVPQGSMVPAIMWPKGGGQPMPYLRSDNAGALRKWRGVITGMAKVVHNGRPPIDSPVAVYLEFSLPRPKSVRRAHHSVKPDVDKLVRAVLDGLTKARVWVDDSRVVSLAAHKLYGDIPGVWIVVRTLQDGESARIVLAEIMKEAQR